MTALQMCQIAVAVFMGNVLTLAFAYGFQQLRGKTSWSQVSRLTFMAVLMPLGYMLLAFIAAMPATP